MKEYFGEINRMLDRFLTPAVKVILVINVLSLLFMKLLGAVNGGWVYVLVRLFGQTPDLSVRHLFVWQFLTFNFIHADFSHLLSNMLGLIFFAPALESRWGTKTFWRFYLTAGIGAGIFHALVSILILRDPGQLIIGASGAIYGILLAFAAYYPEQPIYLFGIYPIKAKFLLVIMVLMIFLASSGPSGSRISNLTHFGGLVAAYIWLALRHRNWDIRSWRWTRA